MQTPRDWLTPEALTMLQTIGQKGSFAAAARALDLVPSALTYRVRQIEDALDVLLFDRSSRQAKPTAAGQELLREAARLLSDMDAVANRVRRVATGWEAVLTVAVDSVVSRTVVMDLCASFLALGATTRLKLRYETLSGTLAALTSGQADLALGAVMEHGLGSDIHHAVLGPIPFVYAVASHHALAQAPEPLTDELLQQHRAVAVADSVSRGAGLTIGLLGGQDVFTVPDMQSKLEAQLRGLGGGFLPESLARPYIESGLLVAKTVQKPRISTCHYAWRDSKQTPAGQALLWWLSQLERDSTRNALLQPVHRV
ncbi:LysR family transcriptional regulator [Limnohabitans sp. MMS-10A-160]|uniref:LysR family transcriptional regulator n=1 Tax=unclassified Limnohabitans TaxID=2626134 RepID=UPI000D37526E|nr:MULTISPECIES: LysR family transcriptional regulator [unclassified Limnohabitans]PUE22013.1 LysR family transcriptional regulator [Limnohabitans sp. MMS-10A-192]PUE25664.1 LysR family transcriptional regulator [Limnohabitans sp. MMS-10A-160]